MVKVNKHIVDKVWVRLQTPQGPLSLPFIGGLKLTLWKLRLYSKALKRKFLDKVKMVRHIKMYLFLSLLKVPLNNLFGRRVLILLYKKIKNGGGGIMVTNGKEIGPCGGL